MNTERLLLMLKRLQYAAQRAITFEEIQKFYEELYSFSFNCDALDVDNIETLSRCSISYVDCVANLTTDLCNEEDHISILRGFLEAIWVLSKNKRVRDTYAQLVVVPLTEKSTDPDVKMFFSKELLKCLFVIMENVNVKVKESMLNISFMQFYKLIDMLSTCNDFEHQLTIMKIIFCLFSDEQLKEHANTMFPESNTLPNDLKNVSRQHFDNNIREFLNGFNSESKKIRSFKFDRVFLDSYNVTAQNALEDDVWVDFNVNSITILCSKASLTKDSLTEEDPALEVLTIYFNNVELVDISKSKSVGSVIQFKLTAPCAVLHASSEDAAQATYLKLTIFNGTESNELEKLLSMLFAGRVQTKVFSSQGVIIEQSLLEDNQININSHEEKLDTKCTDKLSTSHISICSSPSYQILKTTLGAKSHAASATLSTTDGLSLAADLDEGFDQIQKEVLKLSSRRLKGSIARYSNTVEEPDEVLPQSVLKDIQNIDCGVIESKVLKHDTSDASLNESSPLIGSKLNDIIEISDSSDNSDCENVPTEKERKMHLMSGMLMLNKRAIRETANDRSVKTIYEEKDNVELTSNDSPLIVPCHPVENNFTKNNSTKEISETQIESETFETCNIDLESNKNLMPFLDVEKERILNDLRMSQSTIISTRRTVENELETNTRHSVDLSQEKEYSNNLVCSEEKKSRDNQSANGNESSPFSGELMSMNDFCNRIVMSPKNNDSKVSLEEISPRNGAALEKYNMPYNEHNVQYIDSNGKVVIQTHSELPPFKITNQLYNNSEINRNCKENIEAVDDESVDVKSSISGNALTPEGTSKMANLSSMNIFESLHSTNELTQNIIEDETEFYTPNVMCEISKQVLPTEKSELEIGGEEFANYNEEEPFPVSQCINNFATSERAQDKINIESVDVSKIQNTINIDSIDDITELREGNVQDNHISNYENNIQISSKKFQSHVSRKRKCTVNSTRQNNLKIKKKKSVCHKEEGTILEKELISANNCVHSTVSPLVTTKTVQVDYESKVSELPNIEALGKDEKWECISDEGTEILETKNSNEIYKQMIENVKCYKVMIDIESQNAIKQHIKNEKLCSISPWKKIKRSSVRKLFNPNKSYKCESDLNVHKNVIVEGIEARNDSNQIYTSRATDNNTNVNVAQIEEGIIASARDDTMSLFNVSPIKDQSLQEFDTFTNHADTIGQHDIDKNDKTHKSNIVNFKENTANQISTNSQDLSKPKNGGTITVLQNILVKPGAINSVSPTRQGTINAKDARDKRSDVNIKQSRNPLTLIQTPVTIKKKAKKITVLDVKQHVQPNNHADMPIKFPKYISLDDKMNEILANSKFMKLLKSLHETVIKDTSGFGPQKRKLSSNKKGRQTDSKYSKLNMKGRKSAPINFTDDDENGDNKQLDADVILKPYSRTCKKVDNFLYLHKEKEMVPQFKQVCNVVLNEHTRLYDRMNEVNQGRNMAQEFRKYLAKYIE